MVLECFCFWGVIEVLLLVMLGEWLIYSDGFEEFSRRLSFHKARVFGKSCR